MVQVEIHKRNNHYVYLKAQEHADNSIICAAVSGITQGLVGTLMNINPSPNIKALSIESGMVAIETDISENQDIIDAIYLFAHVSLAQIEKKHPQNVNIQIIQVD